MSSNRRHPALDVLPGELAVCRLDAGRAVPDWAWTGGLVSVTFTADELSVVCAAAEVPEDVVHTAGWRALKIRGPLDFALVGILAGLSGTLAEAGVSIFAVSTHDTDYILVRGAQLEKATDALKTAGYEVAWPPRTDRSTDTALSSTRSATVTDGEATSDR